LERHKKARARSLVHFHVQDVLPVEEHLPGSDFIVRVAGQHFRQRALSGSVRPHEGVHFSARDGEAEVPDDLGSLDVDAQVVDFQLFAHDVK